MRRIGWDGAWFTTIMIIGRSYRQARGSFWHEVLIEPPGRSNRAHSLLKAYSLMRGTHRKPRQSPRHPQDSGHPTLLAGAPVKIVGPC